MSTVIKVITFDLDNTLWDVEPVLIKAEQAQRQWLLEHRPGTMENMGHEALWEFKKSVWKRHPELAHQIGRIRVQLLIELQQAAGYSHEDAQNGAATAFQIFLNVRQQVSLYAQALEVLAGLAGRYTLGALTNGNADIYKTDAAEYFDFAFLAEDVNASKPAPDMFHAAMNKAGVNPDQIIHVGDNPQHDVVGAQALGIHTIWMNSQAQDWPGGKRADREIDNLKQLPEAIASIADPSQL